MSPLQSHFILLYYIFQAIHSHLIKSSLNAQQIKPNIFVDNIGALTVNNINNIIQNSSHRRFIDTTACSTPPYTSSCTSTNPNNCPCTSFTTTEKEQILDAHNSRRDLAASGNEKCATATGTETNCPSATNMNYLFWDNGLETISTYWAHQCIWGHHNNEIPGEQYDMYQIQCDSNNCLATGYNGNAIGENLAASGTGGTAPNWNMDAVLNGINNWYDESTLYYYNDRTSFGVTGHWTQGVWAQTRYIGCGYAACSGSGPFSSSITNWFNLVCKYFPAGNYPRHPYESGSKCSACDTDRNGCVSSPIANTSYNGLCGGGQCKECAVDFGQQSCTYNDTSCPSTVLCSDGLGRDMNCGPIASASISELWDHKSEQALIAGVVGSFFALIIVLNAIGYIIYCIVKKNGIVDTDMSKSSSMVANKTGSKLLFFIIFAFILFLLPCISFAFVKSNVVLGEEYNPLDTCDIGWFLEYFGYECGKLLISLFLIYRIYTAFDNSMYSIPKRHIIHIFFKFVPFLGLLYFILILLGFLLKNQFDTIVSINKFYVYCADNNISGVFVFGHIISFIRELGINSIILYWFVYRLWYMNKNARDIKDEGHYTPKKIKNIQKQLQKNSEPDDIIEENAKKSIGTVQKKKQKNLSKKDIIWNGYINEFGNEPESAPKLQQWAKSDKLGMNATHFTYKQTKEMFNEYKGKGIIGDIEEDEDEEGDNNDTEIEAKQEFKDKTIDINNDDIESAETKKEQIKKQKMKKDKKFNMQNRRGLIIKWFILVIIMFLSSFICQILLCIRKYPSFYIYYDIIIQCICCILLLWFSKPIWRKIVEIFHKICLCHVCCPVLNKQT